MKPLHLILLAACSLVLGGCATPTQIDKGPVKAQTFSFVNGGVPPGANSADGRDTVHRLIQSAITQNLAAKGVKLAPQGGDVIVAYLIVISNGAVTEGISTYFGYGHGGSALVDQAHTAYGEGKNPNNFEAGTLLVDVIDARTFKVLQRKYVVRPALRGASAEVREAQVKEAVDSVLANLPIAP